MIFQINLQGIVLLVITFIYIVTEPITADGISCFKCYASQPGYKETDLLCSQFDGSARFQVYCPSSTLCRKKTIHYKLKSSEIMTVERDCAPQKRKLSLYSDVENKWEDKEEVVKTAYEEGCYSGEDRGAPAGPPEYCFCSFHLCNTSQSTKFANKYHIFFLTAILLFATLV